MEANIVPPHVTVTGIVRLPSGRYSWEWTCSCKASHSGFSSEKLAEASAFIHRQQRRDER